MIAKTATKTELRDEIEKLRNIGNQMSNLCYNLAQSSEQTLDNRSVMDQCRRAWDGIPRSETR